MKENNRKLEFEKFLNDKNHDNFLKTNVENSELSDTVKKALRENFPELLSLRQIYEYPKIRQFKVKIGNENYHEIFNYFFDNGLLLCAYTMEEKAKRNTLHKTLSKIATEKFKKEPIENLPLSQNAKKAISLFKEPNEKGIGYHDKIQTVGDFSQIDASIFFGRIERNMPKEFQQIEHEINSILAVRGIQLKNSEFSIFDLKLEDLDFSPTLLKLFKDQNLHFVSNIIHKKTLGYESDFAPFFNDIKKALKEVGLQFGKQTFVVKEENVFDFDERRKALIQKLNKKSIKTPVHFENSSNKMQNKTSQITIKKIPNFEVPDIDFTQIRGDITPQKERPEVQIQLPTSNNFCSTLAQNIETKNISKTKQAYEYLNKTIEETDLPERLKQNLFKHFPNIKTVAEIANLNKNSELSKKLSYQNYIVLKTLLLNHGIDLIENTHKYPFAINTSHIKYANINGADYLSLDLAESDLPYNVKNHFKKDLPQIKTIGEATSPQNKQEVKKKLKSIYFIFSDVVNSHDISAKKKIENSEGFNNYTYKKDDYLKMSKKQYLSLSIEDSDFPFYIKRHLSSRLPEFNIINDLITNKSKLRNTLGKKLYSTIKQIIESHSINMSGKAKYYLDLPEPKLTRQELEKGFKTNLKYIEEEYKNMTQEEYINMTQEEYLSLKIEDSDLTDHMKRRLSQKMPEIQTIRDIVNSKKKSKIRNFVLGNQVYVKMAEILSAHGIKLIRPQKDFKTKNNLIVLDEIFDNSQEGKNGIEQVQEREINDEYEIFLTGDEHLVDESSFENEKDNSIKFLDEDVIKILTSRLSEFGLSEIKDLPLECFQKNSESIKQIIKSFDNYIEEKIKMLETIDDIDKLNHFREQITDEISEFEELLEDKEKKYEIEFILPDKREKIAKELRSSVQNLYEKFLHNLPSSKILSKSKKPKVYHFKNLLTNPKLNEEHKNTNLNLNEEDEFTESTLSNE